MQARCQEFAMEGGCKSKLKQFSLGIGTVLCPKLGEDQKKIINKGPHLDLDRFCAQN